MSYSIGGAPKLMKMMFLVEHYSPAKRELIGKGLLGNIFFVHNQGVFSNDVMHCFNDLVSGRKIENKFPLKANVRAEFEEEYKERIDEIIDEFKEVPNHDLEDFILTMMGLDRYYKQEHYGTRTSELIRENLLAKEKKMAKRIK